MLVKVLMTVVLATLAVAGFGAALAFGGDEHPCEFNHCGDVVTITVTEPGHVETVTVPGHTETVTTPAETVTVPGATVERVVTVPGQTTTVHDTVTTPGQTTTVTTPGPTRTITKTKLVKRTLVKWRTKIVKRTVIVHKQCTCPPFMKLINGKCMVPGKG